MKELSNKNIKISYSFKIKKGDAADYKSTPIIINNYNRLYCLRKMVNRLENDGYCNIYVIDNNSSYPPLLAYYKKANLRVFRLNENVGYLALWATAIRQYFIDDYYVYSDPDILPDENCPSDYIKIFREHLDDFPELDKVGFGLRIDNLPEHYKLKNEVIQHESKFWISKLSENLYNAPIDTTFALYKPCAYGNAALSKCGRTDFPYVAHHLPWYMDHVNLTEEERWYLNCKKVYTHWSRHPNNFSFFKKYYLLVKKDQLPLIWNFKSKGRRLLELFGLMRKSNKSDRKV